MKMCNIGIYGLGIMGRNLALNLAGKGYAVSVYNRRDDGEEAVTESFVSSARCQGKQIVGAISPIDLVNSLSRPRKILIMVKAGAPVDETIDQLLPHVAPGDIIIDGGNSHYLDTAQRLAKLAETGVQYVGCGISGGAEGALHGPSIMPGGSRTAWEEIGPMLQAIAARSGDSISCCQWIGPEGSGHFVKMVHNGIEYGLLQILAEAYDIMTRFLSMSSCDIASIFREWNRGLLRSYLMRITADILQTLDGDGRPLIDKICDSADHKGTGSDCAVSALKLSSPITVTSEAILARFLSTLGTARKVTATANILHEFSTAEKSLLLQALQDAIYAAQTVAYAQGFSMMATASAEYTWDLDIPQIAGIWHSGCIIQSDLLDNMAATLTCRNGNIMGDILCSENFRSHIEGWRQTVTMAVRQGIPAPCLSSALAFYDGLRSERLPSALIQAQRDYFGAHGFERRDAPRGNRYHSSWGRK